MEYVIEGIWKAKQCILLGIILWMLWNIILFSLKKRNPEQLKEYGYVNLICEILLVIYICTILMITGVIRKDFSYVWSIPNVSAILKIPFEGASIKMVMLNCLLFVPYGFLTFILFDRKKKASWKKAILIGFCSSLFIEVFQSFTGRLPEIDDLIANTAGFLVGYLVAQGFFELCRKETRKNGVIRILGTGVIFTVVLFALSFWANGDKLQAEEDAYYAGIGDVNFEKEYAELSKLNIIKDNKVTDILQKEEGSDMYMNMGIDISNAAAHYTVQDLSSDTKSIQEAGKTYIEMEYTQPQTFRFYNNKSWEMKNVRNMVYCQEDGTLWYGTTSDKIEKCAKK